MATDQHAEDRRLEGLFGRLRERLIDVSSRNPLVSYKHRPTSKRQLRFVDAAPDLVFSTLVDEQGAVQILPLPEPDETPEDERTSHFQSALSYAKTADTAYLHRLEELEKSGTAGEFELGLCERELRDRLRADLDLPPRSARKLANPGDHAKSLGIDPSFDLPVAASSNDGSGGTLQTLKYPEAHEAILERIADDARLAEQEMGLSTLFIVFGFLEWFESESSDKQHSSPLLLLPVKLEKKRALGRKTTFSIVATSERPEANLSLKKRIERDFNRLLPDFVAEEDVHQTVENYLEAVRQSVAGQKRWCVRRQITLGHFAFGRLAMYAELDPAKWAQHPAHSSLVRSVLSGVETDSGSSPSLFGPPDDYPIDDPDIAKIAPHLIHDADASQHSALIDVVQGKNLVIQGPPGTGKSQTITNIIANVIGSGGTVLFLAEKQAALEVVKRRLDRARLGDFCLELHSDRAAARKVVESLKARHSIGYRSGGKTENGRGVEQADGREEISAYLDALHRPGGGARDTPFAAIWKSVRGKSKQELCLAQFEHLPIPVFLLDDVEQQNVLLNELSLYSRMLERYEQRFGSLQTSPWSQLELDTRCSAEIAAPLLDQLKLLSANCARLLEHLHVNADWGVASAAELTKCAEALLQLPRDIPRQQILDAMSNRDSGELRRLFDTVGELEDLKLAHRNRFSFEHSDDATLLAVEKVAAASCAEESELTCEELARAIEGLRSDFGQMFEGLDHMSPLLRHVGLDINAKGGTLFALAVVAELFQRTPSDLRIWVLRIDDRKAVHFREIVSIWERLSEQEAFWRSRFSGLDEQSWPNPAELRHAAGLLRKGLVSRMIGSFSGDRSVIEHVASRLFVPAPTLTSADLEALAAHVERIIGFESNKRHRQLLGTLWYGLDSPFEGLQASTKEALDTLARLQSFEGGLALWQRMAQLPQSSLDQIAADWRYAEKLARLPVRLKTQIAVSTINDIAEGLQKAGRRLVQLSAADPERRLSAFSHSIRELSAARTFEFERRELEARIGDAEHADLAPLLQIAGNLSGARVGLNWRDMVESMALSGNLRSVLLGCCSQAEQLRARAESIIFESQLVRERGQILTRNYALAGLNEENEALHRQLGQLLSASVQLKSVLELRDQRSRIGNLGVEQILALAETLDIPATLWCELLSALIATSQARDAKASVDALRRASGMRLDAQRSAFIDRDRQKIGMDREILRGVALTSTPIMGNRFGPRKTWTELSLINNEFGKEKRFVPVRDLLARAAKSVQAMKPCFMMSPLSLAKFLPPGRIEFDLLVIDEASQMRPEDALGGLLRAKQIVVVGDQKQLPPTDFFNRSGDDVPHGVEDDESDDVDDESVLEACQKAFDHTRMLRWHYRSRCESLIAFSNHRFYDNQLITFPMARPGSFSVELRKVEGAYEARRNQPEAAQVVAYAIAFMREHADDEDQEIPTIGIVAINTEQRELIREELRLRSSRDETVERYKEKVKALGEEVFIKNLENVQGDERDIILISLTYGPKSGQKTPHQRFGPINGKHGHRRLNVLFTRARDRIVLFTSLQSDQIVGGPTGNPGAGILKEYLKYAEGGGRQEVPTTVGDLTESDFEHEVRTRLVRRGYKVDTQIGVSGYRIDLGVHNPDDARTYLAGVECDGATYHSSKSARDRDRLRQDCLEEKGWHILRVWSTDWFDDPDGQTEKLVRQLDLLRASGPSKKDNKHKPVQLETAFEVPDVDEPDADPFTRPGLAVDQVPGDLPIRPAVTVVPTEADTNEGNSRPVLKIINDALSNSYRRALISDSSVEPIPDRFFEPAYRSTLRVMAKHIVEIEQPIYRAQLVTRLARAHGFQRTSEQIEKCLLDAISDSYFISREEDGRVVCWTDSESFSPVVTFRDPNEGDAQREVISIPLVELAGLARKFRGSRGGEEVVLERMKYHLGLGRLKLVTRSRLVNAIRIAEQSEPVV